LNNGKVGEVYFTAAPTFLVSLTIGIVKDPLKEVYLKMFHVTLVKLQEVRICIYLPK